MSGAVTRQRPVLRHAGFLAQTRQRVILAQDRDHRATLSGLAHDRGRDTGQAFGHAKAFGP